MIELCVLNQILQMSYQSALFQSGKKSPAFSKRAVYLDALMSALYQTEKEYLVRPEEVRQLDIAHKHVEISSFGIDSLDRIPASDMKILKDILSPSVILAGGSIVSCLLNNDINDYDIFFIGTPEECEKNAREVIRKIRNHIEEQAKEEDCSLEDLCSDESCDDEEDETEGIGIEEQVEEDSSSSKSSDDEEDVTEETLEDNDYIDLNSPIFRSPGVIQIKDFQLILFPHKSIKSLLCSFDLGCCEVAFDGKRLMYTKISKFVYNFNMVPLTRSSFIPKLNASRVSKYMSRGFYFFFPFINGFKPTKDVVMKDNGDAKFLYYGFGQPVYDGFMYSRHTKHKCYLRNIIKIKENSQSVGIRFFRGSSKSQASIYHDKWYNVMAYCGEKHKAGKLLFEISISRDDFDFVLKIDSIPKDCQSLLDARFEQTHIDEIFSGFRENDNPAREFVMEFPKASISEHLKDSIWSQMNNGEIKHMVKYYINNHNRLCNDPFNANVSRYTFAQQIVIPDHCGCLAFDYIFSNVSSTLRALDKYIVLLIRSFCCRCRGTCVHGRYSPYELRILRI